MSMILGLFEERICKSMNLVNTKRAEQGVFDLLVQHPMVWDLNGELKRTPFGGRPPKRSTIENVEYRNGQNAVLNAFDRICSVWPPVVQSKRKLVELHLKLIPLPASMGTKDDLPSRARMVWVSEDKSIVASSLQDARDLSSQLERQIFQKAKEVITPPASLLERFGSMLTKELNAAKRKGDEVLKRKLRRSLFDAEDLIEVASDITPSLVEKIGDLGFVKTAYALRRAA